MDRLTSMAVFVKTADLGSFAAAAEALTLSPQMVAKHVVHLEDRLGTALIHRTTRRQSLTDVGRAFYERCRAVLAEAEAADQLALDMRAQPKGVLRVNAPITFGEAPLAPMVMRYLAAHPQVQVDLTLTDRYVDALEEGYDVLVRIGDIGQAGLVALPLAPYRLIACAAPSYLARRGVPTTPAELEAHDCLGYGTWSPALLSRWQFTKAGRTEEVAANGRMRSTNWKALLRAALEGYGVTLGPVGILAEEIAAGRLTQVLADYEGPSRPMYVLYPAGRRPTTKVRSFVDAVMAEFGAT
jgi:DNA-binding transcriptional LysR family regulator